MTSNIPPVRPGFTLTKISDVSEDDSKDLKVYTVEEVKAQPTLMILERGVYDISKFSKYHPGGPDILYFCGQDATVHFYMIHPTAGQIPDMMKKYKVGKIRPEEEDKTYQFRTKFDKEIRRRVGYELRELSPWADWVFWSKVAFLLVSLVLLEASWIYSGPTIFKAVALGLVCAFIGLNIQHDANHGAISPNHKINRMLGYTQDLIGGSRMLWIQQHVVLHHPQTNRTEYDPDIMTSAPVVNMCVDKPSSAWHRFQHLYILPLLHLLAWNWILLGIKDIFDMKFSGTYKINPAVPDRDISLLLRVFYLLRVVILPLYLYPTWYTFLCIYICWGVGSFYLGFFFLLSHNFEGVESVSEDPASKKYKFKKPNPIDSDKSLDWTVSQIVTSSTVGGSILGFFNGGLNYQIEHHLFPRICHVHYSKISPIVREVCEEYGVEYKHFPSIFDNLKSTLKYVYYLGNKDFLSTPDSKKQK